MGLPVDAMIYVKCARHDVRGGLDA